MNTRTLCGSVVWSVVIELYRSTEGICEETMKRELVCSSLGSVVAP